MMKSRKELWKSAMADRSIGGGCATVAAKGDRERRRARERERERHIVRWRPARAHSPRKIRMSYMAGVDERAMMIAIRDQSHVLWL